MLLLPFRRTPQTPDISCVTTPRLLSPFSTINSGRLDGCVGVRREGVILVVADGGESLQFVLIVSGSSSNPIVLFTVDANPPLGHIVPFVGL